MLETGPLTPRMIRRMTLAEKNIRIIWSPLSQAHIPAVDLAEVVGIDVDTILAYSDCPAMQLDWVRLQLLDQPAGVVCVRLSAVPALLTGLALQLRESDPPNRLLEWIAQDSMDSLAERWHLGEQGKLRRDRLDSWLQVAKLFRGELGDLDAVDETPPSLD